MIFHFWEIFGILACLTAVGFFGWLAVEDPAATVFALCCVVVLVVPLSMAAQANIRHEATVDIRTNPFVRNILDVRVSTDPNSVEFISVNNEYCSSDFYKYANRIYVLKKSTIKCKPIPRYSPDWKRTNR